MELSIQVQILDEAVCISLCANALGKGMNLSVLPPAMEKYYDWMGSLLSVKQLVQEREISESNQFYFALKLILSCILLVPESLDEYILIKWFLIIISEDKSSPLRDLNQFWVV